MSIDLPAVESFMAAHARLLDRRRFAVRFGGAAPGGVLAALDAYRNADGGYGWGLEPDLRASESQPVSALHAFEVFEDIAPATSPRAAELCDWLASVSRPDGGLPFALPVADPAGCAPFWVGADASVSSLHITSCVAGIAHRVARHDPTVAAHPWLAGATAYCLGRIAAINEASHALELLFVLQLLDAITDTDPSAEVHLDRLTASIPASGQVAVGGGAADEKLYPLDFTPAPHRPLRARFAPDAVATDIDRLVARQRPDAGWDVDWDSYSPIAAFDWRGHATVRALTTLRANGVD